MQNACNGSPYNFFIAKFVNFGMFLNLKRDGNVAIKWGWLWCQGRINITQTRHEAIKPGKTTLFISKIWLENVKCSGIWENIQKCCMGVVNIKQKVNILYLCLDSSVEHQGWRLVTILTMHGEAVAVVIDNMYTWNLILGRKKQESCVHQLSTLWDFLSHILKVWSLPWYYPPWQIFYPNILWG